MDPTLEFASALTSSDHWLMVAITTLLVALAVVVHFEALERLNRAMPRLPMAPRWRILVLIVAIMAVHVAEIWIFGAGIYLSVQVPGLGRVAGVDTLYLLDAVYVSAANYTTLGYGDLTPVGPIRLLMGTEALAGFVLLTWSASFTFLEMQRYWKPR